MNYTTRIFLSVDESGTGYEIPGLNIYLPSCATLDEGVRYVSSVCEIHTRRYCDKLLDEARREQSLSEAIIKNLPEIKIPIINHSCVICREDYKEDDDIIGLACTHGFHKVCVIKWFEKMDNCPYCRQKVVNCEVE